MIVRGTLLALGLTFTASPVALAQDAGKAPAKDEKKVDGHCEKVKDGKTVDIEAKDRAECKKQGGKWQKGPKHDKHDHD